MRWQFAIGLTLALATSGCSSMRRALGLASDEGSATTTVFGHWVLATPIDSTAFAGASQVDLVLAPGSFTLTATYPTRAPLTVAGRADLAAGGLLTLVPSGAPDEAAAVGLATGQALTRLASASGATLVLAPPSRATPVPSSVWHRIEAARIAGTVR